ncbi:MAG: DUF1553 domain-containing protein [Candidatus Hydrogenedentes bacterium]|nr:DUF1553 domain-containing protein [Candidatus Hydrogenedentota bacterium]
MKYSLQRTLGLCLAALSSTGAIAAPADFQQDILPILGDRCFACHGPDASQRKAELRLDVEADAKKTAIVPGQADTSELIKRVLSTDPKEVMPPPDSGKPALSPEEAALFQRWISEGAKWQGHWAFTPPVKTAPPEVALGTWPRNDLDRFVLARLESKGLAPSPEASRETLIRRLYLDLTGLPPSLEAVDALVMDNAPDAYDRLVDQLLASPDYGEMMARHWLDSARYADTNGYQNDFQRVMWPWRDWVIRAFNDNMPYDQFLIEQIAGDLLPNATESQRIATGFNRNNKSVTEGGSIEAEWQVENIVDRVETTSTAFLGLTMGCARCHDHKYDPITQKEFYEFYAFFNSTEDKGFYEETRGNTGPQVYLPSFEQQRKLNELDGEVNRARLALEGERARIGADYDAWLAALRTVTPASEAQAPRFAAPLRGELPPSATSTAPTWTSGLLGQALMLNGTPEATLSLGDGFTFDREKPFSVSLWARPDGDGALFSKMDEANGFRGVDMLAFGDGRIDVHVINAWDSNAIKIVSEPAFTPGAWSHFCLTYDGSSKASGLRLYVNGIPVGVKVEKDVLTGPIDTAQPLRIGQRTASTYLKGAISDLAFFDRALAESEPEVLLESALAAALPAEVPEEQAKTLRAHFDARIALQVKPQQAAFDAAQKARNEFTREIPSVMVMQERTEPRPTYVLKRGVYDAPDTTQPLQPDTPDFLPPLKAGAPRNRLGLAQWMADPANPLTPRVAVNALWQSLFGVGLVKTTEDFGVQSTPPANPALLDHLALHFVESGWNIKAMLKTLVTSATYRQSSTVSEALLAADPEGLLYSRALRYRLSAETVRDTMLSTSGLLRRRLGGPSVMPYQPDKLWDELAGGAGQGPYVQSHGADLYRRSLYTYRKRTVPHPTLTSFDAPSFEKCLVRRGRTNTPLQALALLNGPTYIEAARNLAQRMMAEAQGDPRDRIAYGFRLTTGRRPSQTELDTLAKGFEGFSAKFNGNPEAATQLVTNGESPVPESLPKGELAAYTTVAGVLMNLDEAITRE